MAGAARLRIAVVDDSVVVRRLVADTLLHDPRVAEVRTASDGREGAELVRAMRPDLVTMDIEMPVLDGIGAVRAIRAFDRRVPIIMFSTLTEAGARATIEAMSAGATDFVTKPGQARSLAASLQTVRRDLVEKVIALTGGPTPHNALSVPPPPRPAADGAPVGTTAPAAPSAPVRATRPGLPAAAPRILAIGASTGGPEALARVLPALPADFPVPVVVTQHMPPMFTRMLAERLDAACTLRVREAADGDPLTPGTVLLAPGGRHLSVARDGTSLRARLTDTPPVNSCRPAVDVLFASLPPLLGGAVLAVVLTGMGADGASGAAAIAAAGGRVWVQDEATSVVWGMPGATFVTGVVEQVLPIDRVAETLIRTVATRPGRRPVPVLALPGGAA